MNHGSHGVYNTGSSIKFKTSIIKSSLCHHSDTYILLKEIITVPNTGTAAALIIEAKDFQIVILLTFRELFKYY